MEAASRILWARLQTPSCAHKRPRNYLRQTISKYLPHTLISRILAYSHKIDRRTLQPWQMHPFSCCFLILVGSFCRIAEARSWTSNRNLQASNARWPSPPSARATSSSLSEILPRSTPHNWLARGMRCLRSLWSTTHWRTCSIAKFLFSSVPRTSWSIWRWTLWEMRRREWSSMSYAVLCCCRGLLQITHWWITAVLSAIIRANTTLKSQLHSY